MKLWKRIKYRVLVWLLEDVCEKSYWDMGCCNNCECDSGYFNGSCGMIDVRLQARKVYMPEEARDK